MHLLLTDRLTCPRCGPTFGLILRADRMGEERRVVDGVLGCPNCRGRYPVREGFGDLRGPPPAPLPAGRAGDPADPGDPAAERLQALLGVAEGPGTLALVGAPARYAAALAARTPGVEIAAVDAGAAAWPDVPGVSRMVSAPTLALFDATARACAVDGALGGPWLHEAVRATVRRGRVVVTDAPDGAAGALVEAGAEVLAEESGTVVAARG